MEASTTHKTILVLGSGMVAPPCIEYLSRNQDNHITVGEFANNRLII